MDEKDAHSAFMSALTTEHFVLQNAANATVSDAAARSSLYVFALSSSLVAISFASRSPSIFVPFVAIVLPGLFLCGLLTIVRLIDTALENLRYLEGIARIRSYYRTLTPEAAEHFAVHHGRWPERQDEPSLEHGPLFALFTTSAGTVAIVNNIVAGVGAALLTGKFMGDRGWIGFPLTAGAVVMLTLTLAFVLYERWRFRAVNSTTARDESHSLPSTRADS
jgi:hypothetical protein